jgi:sugar lactone lactonase YvrE
MPVRHVRPETGAQAVHRALTVSIALVVALCACALTAPGATARLEVRVLAKVPPPGYPASTVVAPDGTIYTGTFKSFTAASPSGPSNVFAYSSTGQLLRTYTVQGQAQGVADAVQVATMDRSGTLYLLDQDPARIIKLDPQTGAQTTWATFSTLPACPSPGAAHGCSDGTGGNAPEPDFAAWGPDGSLYVTDYNQAVIWRVPPSGGAASVWLTDPRFNGFVVGPAGIELMPDQHALMVSTGGGGIDPATGKLYTVAIEPNGQPGPMVGLWESAPAEAPDGFALARSGDVYLSLVGPSGNAVVELSPHGAQVARVPQNAADNELLSTPFDAPGSVSFDGNELIVTNEASISNDTADWALLEIDAGEPGLAPSLPPTAPTSTPVKTSYRLTVSPARARAGRRTRFRFTAVGITGAIRRPVGGARVTFDRRSRRTGAHGRVTLRLVLRRGRHRARLRVAGRVVATVLVRVH